MCLENSGTEVVLYTFFNCGGKGGSSEEAEMLLLLDSGPVDGYWDTHWLFSDLAGLGLLLVCLQILPMEWLELLRCPVVEILHPHHAHRCCHVWSFSADYCNGNKTVVIFSGE